MNSFITHLNQFLSLSPEEEEKIKETLNIRQYSRGSLLLSEGDIAKSFYFNLSGFVRLFYTREGEERTAYFYPENTFISPYESFVRQQASAFSLQATEDTQVVEISVEASVKLLTFSPKFEALARIAMEDELIAHQKMIASLLTLSPEERYSQLLNEEPTIFQRVPQHYLASYIGVKPESLSRIKRRVLKK